MMTQDETQEFLFQQEGYGFRLVAQRYDYFVENNYWQSMDGIALTDYSCVECAQMGVLASILGDYRLLAECVLSMKGEPIILEWVEENIAGRIGEETFWIPSDLNSKWGLEHLVEKKCAHDHLRMTHLLAGGESLVKAGPWGHFLIGALSSDVCDFENQLVSDAKLPLPALVAGRVEAAGLLDGLLKLGKSQGSAAEWFDDMLCWASPEMVAAYPGQLDPFDSIVRLIADGPEHSTNYHTVTLNGPASKWEVNDIEQVGRLTYGLLPKDRHGNGIDFVLGRNFLPSVTEAVFSANPVLVLCRTSVAFLDQFAREPAGNQSEYDDALKSYLPLNLLALRHMEANGTELGSDPAVEVRYDFGPKGILTLERESVEGFLSTSTNTPEVAPGIQKLIPERYLQAMLYKKMAGSISPDDAAHLRDAYGADITGSVISVNLSDEELKALEKKAVLLRSDCKVTFRACDYLSAEQLQGAVTRARAFFQGRLEVCGVDMDTATEAEILARWHELPAGQMSLAHEDLRVVGRMRGFDAFLPVLKGQEDWAMAYQFFGADAVEPYIDRLPDRLATKMCMDGFSI
ncbi:hypothetical protein HNP46_006339 [Pseudomonas nitritireducens]|uniref:Uncharacterized protein n=1 Tax=Pseudomonas nitroreducens TaxID=46680 RepID=A0A7W7P468_PSENT|nr:hypothetical protein [Pseudomonas nitritireducens]MBB4867426.1 hypothetical protein [Pseudomonas nitritireducens]